MGSLENDSSAELTLETLEEADARIARMNGGAEQATASIEQTLDDITAENLTQLEAEAADQTQAAQEIDAIRHELGIDNSSPEEVVEMSPLQAYQPSIRESLQEKLAPRPSAYSSMQRASDRDAEARATTYTEESGQEASQGVRQLLESLANAHDMRSLNQNLAQIDNITNPEDGYVYKMEDQRAIINSLKGSEDPNLQRITNTGGLRDKVKKLLLLKEAA